MRSLARFLNRRKKAAKPVITVAVKPIKVMIPAFIPTVRGESAAPTQTEQA
ncbi:MAG: hypothetical protein V3U16_03215 [Candidatus Neomarinimicrobiota bacterium]